MNYYARRSLLLPMLLLIAATSPALADGGRVIIPIGLILVVVIFVVRLIMRGMR